MKTKLVLVLALFTFINTFSQLGIGTTTPNASAQLDIVSTTKGLLIPRMTELQRTSIPSPVAGLMVYQNNNTTGFYYYNGSAWTHLADTAGSAQKIDNLEDGKSDTNGSTVFLGKDAGLNDDGTDNQNTGVGFESQKATTTGSQNVSVGYHSLYTNITGPRNTAIGSYTLYSNNDGEWNTAIGSGAGYSNISGNKNVFLGYDAGFRETGSNKLYISNSNADADNVMIYGEFDNNILRTNATFQIGNPTGTGYAFPTTDGTVNQVLQTDGNGAITWSTTIAVGKIDDLSDGKSDSDGTDDGSSIFLGIDAGDSDDSTDNKNVGIGYKSMEDNTSGGFNTAIGYESLTNNTTGSSNVAMGKGALNTNTEGNWNIALGNYTLNDNTIGKQNIAIGYEAMEKNVTGDRAIAIGYEAMRYTNDTATNFENENVALGYEALRGSTTAANNTGNRNTAIGYQTLLINENGGHNTVLGYKTMTANTEGHYNTAVGASALGSNDSGDENSIFGNLALYTNTDGNNNVAMGYRAGYQSEGNGNVFVGYEAGFSETGSNTLYIDNSNTSNPLIYGDFSTNELKVNGELEVTNKVGIGTATPNARLHVFHSGAAEPIAYYEATDDVSVVINGQGGESYLEIQNDDTTTSNSWKLGLNDANRLDIQYGTANTMNSNSIGISVLPDGKVGIDETVPEAELDINGQIKIGSSAVTAQAGMMRWNSTTSDFEGYTGTAWVSLTKTETWGLFSLIENYHSSHYLDDDDLYGFSVSLDGDYAIVGRPGYENASGDDAGFAQIYKKDGVVWKREDEINPESDGVKANDEFGSSVAISGDYAIIGAPLDDFDSPALDDFGSAYIYKRSGTSWTKEEKIISTSGNEDDQFGYSVAIDGEYVIIGSPYDDDSGNSNIGSASIFKRSGTSWSFEAKLTASDGKAGDEFGYSVTISGDYVIIGAPKVDHGVWTDSGSAYIFKRTGTNWNEEDIIKETNTALDDHFGASVSIDEDYAVVGVPGYGSDSGMAFVFKRSGTSWNQTDILWISELDDDDQFGKSVSIDGAYIVVGMPGNNSDKGSSYVFKKRGVKWIKQAKLNASNGELGDKFGYSVSIDGNYIIIGAPWSDSSAFHSNVGTVYFFDK